MPDFSRLPQRDVQYHHQKEAHEEAARPPPSARARQQLLRHDVEHRPRCKAQKPRHQCVDPAAASTTSAPNSGSTAPESTPVQKARRFDLPRLVHRQRHRRALGKVLHADAERQRETRRQGSPRPAASANARPTAMPSGMLCSVMAERSKKSLCTSPPPRRAHELVEQEERQRAEHDARRGGQETAADGPLPPSVRWRAG